ncbi:MAG: hypothetical protein ACK6BS_02755, partial [Pseudanabaena sp.]
MIQVEQSIRQLEDAYSLNERSLEILARAINRSQGSFALIIVNCNYHSLRQKLLISLSSKTGSTYRELWWRESPETLYDKLQNSLQNSGQNLGRDGQAELVPALMCLGLEQTSPEHLEDLFFEANLFRDRLKQQLKCPLVLWLNDRELQQLWINAPELANLAAPPIKFGLSPEQLDIEVQKQVDRLFEIARDPQIPLFWQDTKIDADQELFSYSELDLARREMRIAQYKTAQEISLELEAKLDFALGRLLWRSKEAIASDVYEESQGEVDSVSQIYYR